MEDDNDEDEDDDDDGGRVMPVAGSKSRSREKESSSSSNDFPSFLRDGLSPPSSSSMIVMSMLSTFCRPSIRSKAIFFLFHFRFWSAGTRFDKKESVKIEKIERMID